MDIRLAWFVAFAVFLLLRFVVVKWLRKKLEESDFDCAPGIAAQLALASLASSVALVAVCSLGLVMALVIYARMLGGDSVAVVSVHLERLRDLYETWIAWAPGWSIFAALVFIVGLGIFSYRKSLIRCGEALEAVGRREIDLLIKKLGDGTLEPLPPTERMKEAMKERD
ncbi:MAG TPA: hypothetical protein VK970_23315, partial [Candidatus Methylacidiphilales bacterium]|nr:hypothetical protein [Candidatus Methylacidiphilales bacterium]